MLARAPIPVLSFARSIRVSTLRLVGSNVSLYNSQIFHFIAHTTQEISSQLLVSWRHILLAIPFHYEAEDNNILRRISSFTIFWDQSGNVVFGHADNLRTAQESQEVARTKLRYLCDQLMMLITELEQARMRNLRNSRPSKHTWKSQVSAMARFIRLPGSKKRKRPNWRL